MVAGGLPEPLDDHAERIVDLGLTMIEVAARHRPAGGACSIRVGVHSGPVLGGVIGRRKFAFDLWGDTVNIASRLESHGIPDRVHVSDATWQLVRHRFQADPRGPTQLRGKGAMETYAIVGRAAGGLTRGGRYRSGDAHQDASREEASVGDKGPGSKSKDTKKKTGKKK